MKFKFLYSLMATICLTGYTGGFLYNMQENVNKKPVNTGAVISYPKIEYVVDTLFVNDDNFDQLNGRAAAGVFNPGQNKVVVYYWKTDSKKTRIKNYCNINNKNMPLTARHEMEHARKASMTKNTGFYSPHARGCVAAMNEIMAPASEIIEAIDRQYDNRKQFPASKVFIKKAREKIAEIAFADGYNAPANFRDSRIADITLDYALQYFLGQVKLGTYKTTVRRAIDSYRVSFYKPNSESYDWANFLFNPDFNMWGPLFTYDTHCGRVDLWNAATPQMRAKVVHDVDSVINSIKNTGKSQLLINMQKMH